MTGGEYMSCPCVKKRKLTLGELNLLKAKHEEEEDFHPESVRFQNSRSYPPCSITMIHHKKY